VPRARVGWIGRIVAAGIVALVRVVFRVRVEGTERVPRDGPGIIVANHVSALDGVVLAGVFWWKYRIAVRFVIAAEFFRNPVFGAVLRLFDQVPVHRGTHDLSAIAEAVEAARSASLVGIFPEGRVNPQPDGPLQTGRTGAARIALASGAPVIPVGISGTQRRWPRPGIRWSRPLRPRVVVSIGEPVVLEGDDSYDAARAATHDVMAAIERQVAAAKEPTER
jgi:1-acyl-sn-glycerol-3-phosphate acyltransferase